MRKGTCRAFTCLIVIVTMFSTLVGCTKKSGNATEQIKSTEVEQNKDMQKEKKADPKHYEAEDTELTGNISKGSAVSGYSGTGYAEGFKEESDGVTFVITSEKSTFYDLTFTLSSDEHKLNPVLVDGIAVGDIVSDTKEFTPSTVKRVYLSEGEHIIKVGTSWGYIRLDKLTVTEADPLPADLYKVEAKLANPDSSEATKRLMSFLLDCYGNKIITGQYCDNGFIGTENAAIYNVTGDYPAMLGLDFMNYSPTNTTHGATANSTKKALDYAAKGGISTFCWHWTVPDDYVTGNWYGSFYTEQSKFNLAKALSGEDKKAMDYINESIEAIAEQILILKENDVPILFRPLHEASGGWFWWGNSGAKAYIELYRLIFDRLTNEFDCNNIIWVWNGQDPEWYPGDEYVDIIGIDIYPGEHVYSSQINSFLKCAEWSESRKIITLSENGCLFDPELAARDGAYWSYIGTWGGEFVIKSKFAKYSEKYTEEDMLKKVYQSDIMITRSKLPDLKTYPLREEFK